jgi:hypothetical protein
VSQCFPMSMATKVLFAYCNSTRGLQKTSIDVHVIVGHCVDQCWDELIIDHVAALLIL